MQVYRIIHKALVEPRHVRVGHGDQVAVVVVRIEPFHLPARIGHLHTPALAGYVVDLPARTRVHAPGQAEGIVGHVLDELSGHGIVGGGQSRHSAHVVPGISESPAVRVGNGHDPAARGIALAEGVGVAQDGVGLLRQPAPGVVPECDGAGGVFNTD